MLMQFVLAVVGLFSLGFGAGYLTRSLISRRRRRRPSDRVFHFVETTAKTGDVPSPEKA
jgi:hypothetical protein